MKRAIRTINSRFHRAREEARDQEYAEAVRALETLSREIALYRDQAAHLADRVRRCEVMLGLPPDASAPIERRARPKLPAADRPERGELDRLLEQIVEVLIGTVWACADPADAEAIEAELRAAAEPSNQR